MEPLCVAVRTRSATAETMKATRKPRQQAQSIVPEPVARGVMELGRLVDEEPDTMTLHTKEAFGAFTGRRPEAQGNGVHIGGGKRFAAVLKSIWDLSGNDNPYADWLLITMHGRLTELRLKIERATIAKQKLIDLVKTQGLSFSVMRSRKSQDGGAWFSQPLRLCDGGRDRRIRLLRADGEDPHTQGPNKRRGGQEGDSLCWARTSCALPRTHSLGAIPSAARDEGALPCRLSTVRG